MAGIYDVTAALTDLLESVNHTTYSAGSYVEGEWIAGSPTASSIQAVCQPASQAEVLQLFPEGESDKLVYKFWSETKMKTANKATGIEADRVAYAGSTFKIISVEDWKTIGGFHTAYGEKE